MNDIGDWIVYWTLIAMLFVPVALGIRELWYEHWLHRRRRRQLIRSRRAYMGERRAGRRPPKGERP